MGLADQLRSQLATDKPESTSIIEEIEQRARLETKKGRRLFYYFFQEDCIPTQIEEVVTHLRKEGFFVSPSQTYSSRYCYVIRW